MFLHSLFFIQRASLVAQGLWEHSILAEATAVKKSLPTTPTFALEVTARSLRQSLLYLSKQVFYVKRFIDVQDCSVLKVGTIFRYFVLC